MSLAPYVVRFWARVSIGEADACWEWNGARFKADARHLPYGNNKLVGHQERQAHREAYRLVHGSIPPGRLVLHRCDNPPCCNPAHLYVGTHFDNNRDRFARGRAAVGEAHHNAKLTAEDVRQIRQRLDAGEPQRAIAKMYGVSKSSIGAIGRTTWRHV